jgi:hypothetical protein
VNNAILRLGIKNIINLKMIKINAEAIERAEIQQDVGYNRGEEDWRVSP